ncbi:VCBS repeat-containing protein [Sulfitobacter sp. D35]|uniref:FG-GAP repeat domain-containing protein n=1 Tax=Sulfitobacter sp. D35 TaxID=3083252 RepID=UPI00296F04B4|nr:VCBS repeat-containing protein [Sulfitobacter sp. D35]MDW4499853.1 VCBS repeat-containing protein [Sulfitobacter sp. D35]
MRRGPERIARAALVISVLAHAAAAQEISAAEYIEPTTRYAHGVLGDAIEHGALRLTLSNGAQRTLRLPETSVFEDTAPRLADLDGDGAPEVITVESSLTLGARLAIFDATGRVAATPWIGQRNRWLAPVGAADLDGDGHVEIAYVDRPHLARILRVWRFRAGALEHLADYPGVTNHRIGERDISGGIRTCDGAPEVVLTDAGWSRLLALRFDGGSFAAREIASRTTPDDFEAALTCGG